MIEVLSREIAIEPARIVAAFTFAVGPQFLKGSLMWVFMATLAATEFQALVAKVPACRSIALLRNHRCKCGWRIDFCWSVASYAGSFLVKARQWKCR